MGNRKILLISIFIFMIVLSIGAVSASDVADDAIASDNDDTVVGDSGTVSGSVSGGVDVVTENPGTTSGELTYDIPSDAKTIKSADVYVNVYSGSAKTNWGANANISITTDNDKYNKTEVLWVNQGSEDGTVYPVETNNNITKCYSDYMIHYDITSLLYGLNGTSLKINVDTFKMEGKDFDGRIKLIALVLAYDDGDSDRIDYSIDANQIWANSDKTLTFDTSSFSRDVLKSTLTNIALSSSDGTYKINNNFTEAEKHISGSFYYQFNQWNITDYIKKGENIDLYVIPGQGFSGPSYKSVLSVITSVSGTVSSTVKVTDNTKDVVYPEFANRFTVTVDTNKAGKYVVNLLANGEIVNTTEVDLISGTNTLTIIDPTIRPLNGSAKYTGNSSTVYNTVDYQVHVLYENQLVSESASYQATVLYNGYLGKDTYGQTGLEPFFNGVITGNIVILTNGTYAGSTNKYGLTNFTVALSENDSLVKAFMYVTYTYGGVNDNINMFNVALNDNKLTPGYFARDASNLKANSGSGVIVYDVTQYLINGVNVLDLNKTGSAGVYPTTLVYMYNTTGSKTDKLVYIYNGADLLGSYGGLINQICVNSTIDVDSRDATEAIAYIFANGAVDGRGTVVINGESEAHPWSGDAYSTDLYTKDITSTVKDNNEISVIFSGTSGSFTALQQIVVLTKDAAEATATVKVTDNTKDIVYPGFANRFTVTVDTNRAGKYVVNLLANGEIVNTTEVDLISGTNTLTIIDPTIRPLNESAKYTGNSSTVYNTVDYKIQVSFNNQLINESASYQATVLYNGYLGKDTYGQTGLEPFFNGVITGNIVILTNGTYAGSTNKYGLTNFTVALSENDSLVKAFMYVTYTYGGVNDNINMFNVALNDNKLTPGYFARDASNLKANSGSGLIVYDVTQYLINGVNVLDLNKTGSAGVYPTTLVYMYNTSGSNLQKEVYISNGADLLGSFGGLNNPIAVNSQINVNSANVIDATAYIFANGAVDGRGTVVINGESEAHPWSGDAYSTDLYTKDITSTVKNVNEISVIFSGTSGSFTALQQIIVLTKYIPVPTKLTVPSVTKVYNVNKNLVVTLKDANGKAIANAKVTIVLNGAKKVVTTDKNGKATLAIPNLAPKDYTASITYAGDATHIKSTATAKVTVKKASVKVTAKKKTFKAKVKTKKYTVVLKNNKGKAMNKVKLTLKIKGKKFTAKTNAKGKATFKIKKLTKKGKYNAQVIYKGDKYFNKLTKKVQIKIKK